MSKDAVFTLKLEKSLRDDFMEEAAAEHRPASQVIRELMYRYIEERRTKQSSQDPAYQDYVRAMIAQGIADYEAGRIISNEEANDEAKQWLTELKRSSRGA
ncbi:MAG: antitoxin of toxin-antitoxin stability system [Propionibacteriaceae bacterium]|jgi:predicted transcriptional regulator|nr:antitoxin of toxin-antitoxin stability system [Propionibacteriaceae bacterium]